MIYPTKARYFCFLISELALISSRIQAWIFRNSASRDDDDASQNHASHKIRKNTNTTPPRQHGSVPGLFLFRIPGSVECIVCWIHSFILSLSEPIHTTTLSEPMPKIIGKAKRVVEVEGVLAIDEYVGNVGSQTDDISIAVVKISQPTSEPWLTLDYDEWMVVVKGYLEIHYEYYSGEEQKVADILTVNEGETVFIPKGERFKPVFPQAGAEYVPVCIPAFRPDRCLREEEGGINTSEVAENLAKLHSEAASSSSSAAPTKVASSSTTTVYHMCQKNLWEEAVASGKAYFPPTFEADGFFTHATAIPDRLLETANHFYTSTEGIWICLELSTEKLQSAGIMTLFEEPKPVGDQSVSESWQSNKWACPHIFGGIPVNVPGIVTKTFEMQRDDKGSFLSIVGLTG